MTQLDTAAVVAGNATGVDRRRRIAEFVVMWALPLLLVATILVSATTTPGFMSFANLRGILINSAVIGIAAVGLTPVTLSGNLVSLGITQQAMIAAVIFFPLLSVGVPLAAAIVIVIVALGIIGVLQGLFVAVGLNPMITTLAAGAVIFGLGTLVTGGRVVSAPSVDTSWMALASPFGLPLPIFIFVAFTILVALFIDRTVVGRDISLAGANRETARLSGVSHRKATIVAFVIFGVGTAISGIIVAAQAGQATTLDLPTLTFDAIAAVLVGGTAIQGGFGSPLRSALGALMIAIFSNVMIMHGFSHGVRLAAVGALVVVMVSVLHVIRRKAM
jgi:ribose/xylose/arabinose/galactoside ABC-type transport system permease subunit